MEFKKQRADQSLHNRSDKYFKHDKYPVDKETVEKAKISETVNKKEKEHR